MTEPRWTLESVCRAETSDLVEFVASCVTLRIIKSIFNSSSRDWRDFKLNDEVERELRLVRIELDERIPNRMF